MLLLLPLLSLSLARWVCRVSRNTLSLSPCTQCSGGKKKRSFAILTLYELCFGLPIFVQVKTSLVSPLTIAARICLLYIPTIASRGQPLKKTDLPTPVSPSSNTQEPLSKAFYTPPPPEQQRVTACSTLPPSLQTHLFICIIFYHVIT